MGRWAQARRRGGTPPPLVVLAPPPAPTLTDVEGFLTSESQVGDDTGGTCCLYYSPDVGGPFYLVDTDPWAASVSWGALSGLPYGYYKATEVGNGIAYAGESPYSVRYDWLE